MRGLCATARADAVSSGADTTISSPSALTFPLPLSLSATHLTSLYHFHSPFKFLLFEGAGGKAPPACPYCCSFCCSF